MSTPTVTDFALRKAERCLPDHHKDAAHAGRLQQPGLHGPLLIYTDGSVSSKRIARGLGYLTGWGFLGVDGRYGCGRYPQFVDKAGSDVPAITELRAVWHAICDHLPGRTITVVTDNQVAVDTLNRWKTGDERMVAGYVGSTGRRRPPTLELLRRLVAEHPDHLTVQRVRGHSGDILNEGADTLAQLGMRWARDNVADAEVARRAGSIAEGFLASWRCR